LVTADCVERGLACGCTCPECGERLIANHGTVVKQRYFSHESGAECEAAYETALHMLAKEVLAEQRRILLPPLSLSVTRQLMQEARQKLQTLRSRLVASPAEITDPISPTAQVVRTGHYQQFDQVDVEVHLKEVIPDVVMRVAGRKLLVEIFVTHAVTDAKMRWLEENSLPMIEFNFSAADRTIGKDDLKRAFLQPRRPLGNGNSKWVHHPKAKKEQNRLDDEFRATYLDRLDALVKASDPQARAACEHDQVAVVGVDGVRRSMCRKCWKFFGRLPG
jgi:hypothetical protein